MSTEVNREVILTLHEQGRSNRTIAATIGMDESSVRRFLRREKARAAAGAVEMDGILDRSLRPLGVTLPPRIQREHGSMVKAVLFGDTHIPSHDPSVLAIVTSVIRDIQPDLIVHMGDLLDCYAISTYDKDPTRKLDLQDEIDEGRRLLASLRMIAPQARIALLEGNHEDRLRRLLWRMPREAAALTRLTSFQQAMTWPALLGLEELGVEWIPTHEQSKVKLLPKFITKHGTLVRSQSAYTARVEHERYGKSGASGHTHRLGVYNACDHNGVHVWVETGCTCLANPEYAPDPNWQQGFVVVTADRKTGALQVEPINVIHGRAVWAGGMYGA